MGYGYKDSAKQLKQGIKRAYPRCKVSVTIKHVDSIYIKLLAGDFPIYADNYKGKRQDYIQLNHYCFKNDNELSPEMKKFWSTVDDIRQKIFGNHTNPDHDPMTDYFSFNYYIHYHIGDWNKPYVNTREKTASKIATMLKIAKRLVAYKKWMGDTKCDICHKPINGYLYDAMTESGWGAWGTMCKRCWQREGAHLGSGQGQEYVETSPGEFELNRGGMSMGNRNNHLKPCKTKTAARTTKTSLPDKYARLFLSLFNDMSPENLSCDGELSRAEQRARLRRIEQEWKRLERQVGRKVSYDEIASLY